MSQHDLGYWSDPDYNCAGERIDSARDEAEYDADADPFFGQPERKAIRRTAGRLGVDPLDPALTPEQLTALADLSRAIEGMR